MAPPANRWVTMTGFCCPPSSVCTWYILPPCSTSVLMPLSMVLQPRTPRSPRGRHRPVFPSSAIDTDTPSLSLLGARGVERVRDDIHPWRALRPLVHHDDVKPAQRLAQSPARQILLRQTNQPALLAPVHGEGRIAELRAPPRLDLDEHEGVAVVRHHVQFAPPRAVIALHDAVAATRERRRRDGLAVRAARARVSGHATRLPPAPRERSDDESRRRRNAPGDRDGPASSSPCGRRIRSGDSGRGSRP